MKAFVFLGLFLFAGLNHAAAQEPADAISLQQSPDLISVATFGDYQPIGVGVSSDNRLFVSFPNRGGAFKYGLTEIVDGEAKPFPNEAWNSEARQDDTGFASVQDLYVDAKDNLWVLDSKPAPASSIFGNDGKKKKAVGGYFKLVKFNIKTGEAEKIYPFGDLDKAKTALNDVRVDTDKNLAYLSDPGQAAIVVLDLESGLSRTVLAGSAPTTADKDTVLAYAGVEMRDATGKAFSSNVNSIALTRDNKYFYFKPINKQNLYRIETKYLADASLQPADLLANVEDMGVVGITHGMEADAKGNIFLTASTTYSIKYMAPDGTLHTLVKDSRIIWPDSMGIGSDGYIYFSCAQLNREPVWNNGENKTEKPYAVYKARLP